MFASNPTLCIIGLGYVGLPLAVEFGKKITTIGFDINQRRIDELRRGIDHTLELDTAELNRIGEYSCIHQCLKDRFFHTPNLNFP